MSELFIHSHRHAAENGAADRAPSWNKATGACATAGGAARPEATRLESTPACSSEPDIPDDTNRLDSEPVRALPDHPRQRESRVFISSGPVRRERVMVALFVCSLISIATRL